MKNLIFLGLFIFLILAITSCNSDESQIKSSVKHFFTAINDKDMATAKKYATSESSEILTLIGSHIMELHDTTQTKNDNFFISNIKINGDVASADVRTETEKNPINVTLKKQNKAWKVAFDKESIIKMMNLEKPSGDTNVPAEDSMPSISLDPNPSSEPTRKDTQVLQIPN
ncbi:hypothetical protein [Rhizosphaericola mali]|uniref:DUF4878 domain-containing protein n=1 Tax=Rhizosphaericola mali TaxID=2545455 RepID=A0A5P2FVZ5_9BACT|nr:hypothetical protein [Rhizosphaericola mali]QES87686.1 hypothetical protein E0W69_003060 [Rhizosphaericola mali]